MPPSRVDNVIFTGGNTVGVWLTVKDPKNAPLAIEILHSALKTAGIDARAHYDPTWAPQTMSFGYL